MSGKYLVLTELFLPTKGGTAVWAAEVYKRLGGKGIHIVTADVPGAEEIDASHPNTVHRLNLKRVPWIRPESLAMYAKFFFKSLALALTHRFDAIHAFRALPEGLVAWAVARLTFRPVVIYAHGEELTTWGRGSKYEAMRFALRHADRVIANSEYTRDELRNMGVAQHRIVLIYPGVDTERFRPGLPYEDLRSLIGMKPGQRLILSVGRLQRRKGFDQVVRAIPLLAKSGLDVHYALIGIGEDMAYLADLAQQSQVAERVHLLGHVSAKDLPRWYNACDVFAMPNREIDGDTEGFGMVFLEAAACGKPSIAGKAGGTGSAVIDGKTGLRVEAGFLEDVVKGLHKLLGDPECADRIGKEAFERIRREFDWGVVANRTQYLA
jgi:phosphatidylinositol alpha-1,6-mannosyltransferase